MFCLYNEQYWLYALENYTYNLYYLFIVGYICKAYLLKLRIKEREPGQMKESVDQQRTKQKTMFYVVFSILVLIYTGVFVVSVVKEVQSEKDEDSNKKVRYCEGKKTVILEVEYLIFDVLCTIISIVVLIILYKNQVE